MYTFKKLLYIYLGQFFFVIEMQQFFVFLSAIEFSAVEIYNK